MVDGEVCIGLFAIRDLREVHLHSSTLHQGEHCVFTGLILFRENLKGFLFSVLKD